ncbi:MAG: hypothetical protein ACOYB7_14320 [Mycobacterium sp.]
MTTTENVTTWRDLADNLTPAQVRHLAAVERMALASVNDHFPAKRELAREILHDLAVDAAWYASNNAEPGLDLSDKTCDHCANGGRR